MIEEEILDIVRDSTDDGERLNDLVDEFRRGREVGEIVFLLTSENAKLVSIAAWILSELPAERYSADEVVARLRELTSHVNPLVRFHALSAVYPFLNLTEPSTRQLLTKLTEDENLGVRKIAEAALARLSAT